ncbi:MAG: MarR family transcriptional regulator, partial [Sphingobium sp.]|nr:MarR family transcriptional regulator [Sphingobium sp.]
MEDFSYSMGRADHVRRDHRAGLLVIADRIDAADLMPVADAAGLRLLGVAPLAEASARLDGQLQCAVLLLFCPVSTPALEPLLAQVEAQAIQQGMAVILVAGWDTIDLAFAAAQGAQTQLLCNPDHSDLAAALVTAGEERPAPGQVHEQDRDSARLEQLSAEVSRLARTLDALTQRSPFAAPSFDPGPRIADRPSDYIGMPALAPMGAAAPHAYAQVPTLSATQVRDLLRAR